MGSQGGGACEVSTACARGSASNATGRHGDGVAWYDSPHRKDSEARLALGIVLVVIGFIFLLDSLGITTLGFRELWPVALITAGLMILYERARRRYRRR
jgi:hypothetical protein